MIILHQVPETCRWLFRDLNMSLKSCRVHSWELQQESYPHAFCNWSMSSPDMCSLFSNTPKISLDGVEVRALRGLVYHFSGFQQIPPVLGSSGNSYKNVYLSGWFSKDSCETSSNMPRVLISLAIIWKSPKNFVLAAYHCWLLLPRLSITASSRHTATPDCPCTQRAD